MKVPTLNQLYIRRFLNSCFERPPGDQRCRILDLGCGTTPYKSIYSRSATTVVSADLSIADGIDVCLSAEKLPFGDSTFDFVIFTEVIEHVCHPEKAVNEIARVLGPEGRLILTAPFLYGIHEQPNDFQRYTEFGLEKLLGNNGFVIDQIERRGNLFDVNATASAHLLLMATEALVRAPGVGWLFLPLSYLAQCATTLLFRALHLMSARLPSLHPEYTGARLSGSGHLALWTLGYNVVARKQSRTDS